MLLLYINIQYDIDDVFVSDFLKMYMLYNKTVLHFLNLWIKKFDAILKS